MFLSLLMRTTFSPLIFNDFLSENYMCVCMKNHVIRVYWLSGWIIVTWCIWYFMLYYWMIFCTFQVGKYIEGGRLKRIFFLSLSYYVRVCVCAFLLLMVINLLFSWPFSLTYKNTCKRLVFMLEKFEHFYCLSFFERNVIYFWL